MVTIEIEHYNITMYHGLNKDNKRELNDKKVLLTDRLTS